MLPRAFEADHHHEPVVLDDRVDHGRGPGGGRGDHVVRTGVGVLLNCVAEPGDVGPCAEGPCLRLGCHFGSRYLIGERALEPEAGRVEQGPSGGRARIGNSPLPDLPEEYVVLVRGRHGARRRRVGVHDRRLCGVGVERRSGVRAVDAEPVYVTVARRRQRSPSKCLTIMRMPHRPTTPLGLWHRQARHAALVFHVRGGRVGLTASGASARVAVEEYDDDVVGASVVVTDIVHGGDVKEQPIWESPCPSMASSGVLIRGAAARRLPGEEKREEERSCPRKQEQEKERQYRIACELLPVFHAADNLRLRRKARVIAASGVALDEGKEDALELIRSRLVGKCVLGRLSLSSASRSDELCSKRVGERVVNTSPCLPTN